MSACITSVHVGDVWHGDNRITRGRIVQIARVSIYGASLFDPLLSLLVTSDPKRPLDVDRQFYSRVSWLQTMYRPS